MKIKTEVDIPQDKLAQFCQRHNIRKLSLFGSALRDDYGPDSDFDFLVEFEPDQIVGFFSLAQMELELSEILGRIELEKILSSPES